MDKKELIIVRAQSGAGKSTYIKNNFPTAFVCSADHALIEPDGRYVWAAEKLGKAHFYSINACKAAMINNLPLVAADNTNINLRDIKPYINLAEQYGYKVRIIRLVVSPEVSLKRNLHETPEEIVKMQHSKLQDIPTLWGITEEIINNE